MEGSMAGPVDRKVPARTSRRALLVGTAAGAATIAADMLARPGLALAADGMPVMLGKVNTESSTTTIQNGTAGANALAVKSTGATAIVASDATGVGLTGIGGSTGVQGQAPTGVAGQSSSATGAGVLGANGGGGFGVSGTTNEAGGNSFVPGVIGTNNTPAGSFGSGVYGKSVSQRGNGVIGVANTGTDAFGLGGFSAQGVGAYGAGGTAGVQGVSNAGPGVKGQGATNGVEGVSSNATGSGVTGNNAGSGFGVSGSTHQGGDSHAIHG